MTTRNPDWTGLLDPALPGRLAAAARAVGKSLDSAECEDAAADALLRTAKRQGATPGGVFDAEAFAAAAARNLARTAARKRQNRRAADAAIDSLPSVAGDPGRSDAPLAEAEAARWLDRELAGLRASLDSTDRAALRVAMSCPRDSRGRVRIDALAAALGLSYPAAKTRLFRARRNFRELIRTHLPEVFRALEGGCSR